MESWNHIINTALLGTEKRVLKKEDVGEVAEHLDAITAASNKEEAFLQTAALVYNFRQCGYAPMHKEGISLSQAEKEEKPYANELAHRVLYDILETGSNSLFYFWLKQCAQAGKIVQPEIISVLLDKGMTNKSIRSLVYDCCGKRGAWLLQFNPGWKYVDTSTDEELWQTGALEQRKNILAETRTSDPEKARELLKQTWPQENATSKTELLQQIRVNASEKDLSFLEEALNEKSVKVKEAAIDILKLIPESSVVQLYWKHLQPSIELKKEKTLLGFSSKTVIQFLPVNEPDEFIYKTGVEKLSNDKNISDDNFLLYQLLAAIPPSYLEQRTGLTKEEVIRSIQNSLNGRYFISALAKAAIQFNDLDWLRSILALQDQPFYADALKVLPQKEAEQYAIENWQDDNADQVIQTLSGFENEWGQGLAKAILKFTARNPYQYHRGFYNEMVHLLPLSIVEELETCTPQEVHVGTMWGNPSEHITQLLTLKSQTVKAFNE